MCDPTKEAKRQTREGKKKNRKELVRTGKRHENRRTYVVMV
jgi:protein subunit release factor A